MKKIGVFYGTTTGNSESIAVAIANKLSADVHDISDVDINKLLAYDNLILGTSSWGDGDMQDDWDDFVEGLSDADLSGKTVALFGLGDSYSYPDTFAGGMGLLHNVFKDKGCTIVGAVPTTGYEFEDTTSSVVDGKFVGLPLDEDNESEQSDDRIEAWLEIVRPAFGL